MHTINKWGVFILISLGALLSACATGIDATQVTIPSPEEVVPPEVAVEIQNQISENLGVTLDDIIIESVEQVDWPDGCLGLPEEDEVCVQTITPGWLVIYNVDGVEYRYRVDQSGTIIRQEP